MRRARNHICSTNYPHLMSIFSARVPPSIYIQTLIYLFPPLASNPTISPEVAVSVMKTRPNPPFTSIETHSTPLSRQQPTQPPHFRRAHLHHIPPHHPIRLLIILTSLNHYPNQTNPTIPAPPTQIQTLNTLLPDFRSSDKQHTPHDHCRRITRVAHVSRACILPRCRRDMMDHRLY